MENIELRRGKVELTQNLVEMHSLLDDRAAAQRELASASERAQDEIRALHMYVADLQAVLPEKDRMIQVLQDELSLHTLELDQVSARNESLASEVHALTTDNQSLIRRWLALKDMQVAAMNADVERGRHSGSGTHTHARAP
ncbi:hypothetical protein MSPP1_001333 [Malassezia sp. CBS 17886]|nr:hypothetical protein MSPP1_001333 [Malassezia sp. CBS 17886]